MGLLQSCLKWLRRISHQCSSLTPFKCFSAHSLRQCPSEKWNPLEPHTNALFLNAHLWAFECEKWSHCKMLTELLCVRLTFPGGSSRPDCGSLRRSSEYDRFALSSKQENNTLVTHISNCKNRSQHWWFNGIDAGIGSALPWHCVWVWVCVCVHFNHHHHDKRWSWGVKEKVPSVFWLGYATVLIKFKFS